MNRHEIMIEEATLFVLFLVVLYVLVAATIHGRIARLPLTRCARVFLESTLLASVTGQLILVCLDPAPLFALFRLNLQCLVAFCACPMLAVFLFVLGYSPFVCSEHSVPPPLTRLPPRRKK